MRSFSRSVLCAILLAILLTFACRSDPPVDVPRLGNLDATFLVTAANQKKCAKGWYPFSTIKVTMPPRPGFWERFRP